MKTYYQVCAKYAFQKGKAQLASLSLHSTSEYFPYLVSSGNSLLVQSRFFHSVPEAEHYIKYLFTRHPKSTALFPVLDANQLLLF
jgi:hypothetical protein